MAGVTFSFDNFTALIDLNIGIASRLDENRSESFTILFCDFSGVAQAVIKDNLLSLLRTSDSIVHHGEYYFFVMPYTDRYGTGIVKGMFDEVFAYDVPSAAICYPVNGENPEELLESLHAQVKKIHRIDLDCLYGALNNEL